VSNPRRRANLKKSVPGGDDNPDGKIVTKKRQYSRPLRERAREMLEDPDYCEALAARLLIGEAGAVEVWLYRYGYGEPKADKRDEQEERERFEAIRKEVQDIIEKGKAEGKVLDIAVARSSRRLTKLPEPGPLDGT
jgi:hypothetical protein